MQYQVAMSSRDVVNPARQSILHRKSIRREPPKARCAISCPGRRSEERKDRVRGRNRQSPAHQCHGHWGLRHVRLNRSRDGPPIIEMRFTQNSTGRRRRNWVVCALAPAGSGAPSVGRGDAKQASTLRRPDLLAGVRCMKSNSDRIRGGTAKLK